MSIIKYTILAGVALVLLVCLFGGWTTVPAGHRGVEIRMGKVTGKVLGEGFAGKTPLIVSVKDMEVRIQKEQVKTEGSSRDLQLVSIEAALNYHPKVTAVASLYRDIGEDYMHRLIDPSMQESIKAAVAKYTAEELITKREAVRLDIKGLLTGKLEVYGIDVVEFNIVDFDFSQTFNQAIEAKVTAEQSALAAKNKLAQVEFEAQQKVAEAKGKAEAMRVEAIALANSPQILQLRALEKWDGILPKVTGQAAPFIDVTKFTDPKAK